MQFIKHHNKWQFGFWFRHNYYCLENKELCIYFLRFTSFPEEGMVFEKKHYKGFWFRKEIRLPHLVVRRFKIGKFHLSLPIKITFKF